MLFDLILLSLPELSWIACLLIRDKEKRNRLEWHFFPQSVLASGILIVGWVFLSENFVLFDILAIIVNMTLLFLFWERSRQPIHQTEILKDYAFSTYIGGRLIKHPVRKTTLIGIKGVYSLHSPYLLGDPVVLPKKILQPMINKNFQILVSPIFHTFYDILEIPKKIASRDIHLTRAYKDKSLI